MSESIASEVVSAMVGGMFSASALYPLEVLKTRMQAETKATTKSSSSNDDDDDDEDDDKEDEVLPNEQEGATITNSSTADFSSPDKELQHRNQLALARIKREYATAASEGMTSYATLMYDREGGVAPFYGGVVTSAVQSATEKALYFFAYTFLKNG
mmetsp:Transcript_2211/g.4296  ORF Transcript_2211/g.4296 Transcript_2211/m.4296 type:complete len:156 (+) Transcript_2211:259-726(+)